MLATLHEIPSQERLWQLLDNLERIKHTHATAAHADAGEEQQDLQMLYEVEEALLPLISACEHSQSQHGQAPHSAAATEVGAERREVRLPLATCTMSASICCTGHSR